MIKMLVCCGLGMGILVCMFCPKYIWAAIKWLIQKKWPTVDTSKADAIVEKGSAISRKIGLLTLLEPFDVAANAIGDATLIGMIDEIQAYIGSMGRATTPTAGTITPTVGTQTETQQ